MNFLKRLKTLGNGLKVGIKFDFFGEKKLERFDPDKRTTWTEDIIKNREKRRKK